MSRIGSALRWALVGGVFGAVAAAINDTDDWLGFTVAMVVLEGLLGRFFHYRDRVDGREDASMRAVPPSSAVL